MKIRRYHGSLRLDIDAFPDIEWINPFLGPMLALSIDIKNNYCSKVYVGQCINYTNLQFFRNYILKTGLLCDIPKLIKRRVNAAARIMLSYPPMSTWIPAGGKGFSVNKLLYSSVGEYIERFVGAFSILDQEGIVLGSYKELKNKGYNLIAPNQIQFFHETQFSDKSFPYHPFTEDTYLSWTEYFNIITREKVLVPAQFTYLAYFVRQGEKPIVYSTTGGMSYASTFEYALNHGLLEYIERDAINIAWISKIPANKVIIDDEEIRTMVYDALGNMARKLLVVSFPTELKGLFVIAVMGYINNVYVAGAGADISVKGALRKALIEVNQSIVSMQGLIKMYNLRELINKLELTKEDLFDFAFVLNYYAQPDKVKVVTTWLNSLREESVTNLISKERFSNIRKLIYELQGLGYTILVKDFNIHKYGFKGKLLRTFIPELTPAHVPNEPLIGHRRYYKAPIIFGLSKEPYSISDLYLEEPVPFP